MKKERLNLYFEPETSRALAEFAALRQVSRSSVVQAAVASFLSPDGAESLEAALARRLDGLGREIARIKRDQTIALEALDLFVRAWLTATPPLPSGNEAAAQAKGRQRYDSFVEQLALRVQRGGSLARSLATDERAE